MKRVVYICFLLWISQLLMAQHKQVLQVVWKEHKEEFRYVNEFLLEIDAEKADIQIKVVPGNTVRLYLKQSAKNVDVRTAERELKYNHFVAKKERNRLYLHNYAQLAAASKGLSSIIDNEYVIEIPKHCHLKIKNELGEVRVQGLSTTMRYDLQYTGLEVNDSQGKIYVDSRIGDVALKNCQMDAEFILENVSLKLQESGGSFDIQAQFGSIACMLSEDLSLFNANLEHCETTFINRTAIDYDYAISVENAHISVLDDLIKEQIERENDKRAVLRSKSADAVGTLLVKSAYGDVNLY